MKIKIPIDEIKYNSSSYVDPNSRVFEWKNEIYRAISKDKEQFYLSFFQSKLFADLQTKGWMIGTQITEYSLDGYAFVVKHDRIPFLSYCVEWPAVMLKDAALLTLKVCQELAGRNLSLQDAYPWNVYYNYADPVFIDAGSIVEAPQELIWTPYQQFCQFFLYPLYLSSAGLSQAAKTMLFDYINGISEENVIRMLPFIYKLIHPQVLKRVVMPYWLGAVMQNMTGKMKAFTKEISNKIDLAKIRIKFLKELISDVNNIKLPIKSSNWHKYYGDDEWSSLNGEAERNQKQQLIVEIIGRLKPDSVLDMACNRGLFAIQAASMGSRVIAFDKDENCVAQLYLDAKEKGLKILPLVMDVLNPTPAFGWNSRQFPSAVERFQSEMVFAFAIIHHLVFRQYQNFDRIAEMLSAYTKNWVLVEFPLPEDEKVKAMWLDRCSWYNMENFTRSLGAYFIIEGVYDSFPSTRKILLCQKKLK